MAGKSKFYVVWVGLSPGIYRTWDECLQQVKGYPGARYKSFPTLAEAEQALDAPDEYLTVSKGVRTKSAPKALPEDMDYNAIAVDAACSGNPGPMEYQGVYLGNAQQLFHYGPVFGTNNIGEFLAIVHALALINQKGWNMRVYSDSRNAINWVRGGKCKTKLERNARTESLYALIARAEEWLRQHPQHAQVIKWETAQWGEIPADFGRK
ncbi:MAG: ribonuclease H family protein [Paraprevotella sp.]|nr:ribonuclease H family protein [Paraprevotella sp.]